MKIAAYVRANDSRTNERVEHFGNALGARLSTRERPIECDLAIQAGFQISPAMQDAMNRGIPFIILENPVWHYGDKLETYTWGYNGLNGLSVGSPVGLRPARPHPELQPWKADGEGVPIIFGQVEGDKALRGKDIHEWVKTMKVFYPTAEVREHPVMLNADQKSKQESFESTMQRCGLAITYNSTVGAEAVIRGIPTVADGPGGWAGEWHRGEDRSEWVKELSWRHWSVGEEVDVEYILSGYDYAAARARAGYYDNMSNGRPQNG